ncbi:MAG: hypothetical protein ACT4ON_12080 [Bacteroidota bacterium]
MKASSLSELQKELALLERKQISELCIRLAKYKKENKEYLSYLLFESQDEKGYINSVKAQVDEGFSIMNRKTSYLTKKSLRKILRVMNRYIKYSASQKVEVELRIYFCSKVRLAKISLSSSALIHNLYYRELEKAKKVLSKMHEDLQYDYQQELDILR